VRVCACVCVRVSERSRKRGRERPFQAHVGLIGHKAIWVWACADHGQDNLNLPLRLSAQGHVKGG